MALRSARVPVCVCCTSGIIDLIGKKWTLCILVTLGNTSSVRFNALLKALPGISPRTLSDTLKELLREGIVTRTVFPEAPPRVEYALSDQGLALRRAVVPLMDWAAARTPALVRARPGNPTLDR